MALPGTQGAGGGHLVLLWLMLLLLLLLVLLWLMWLLLLVCFVDGVDVVDVVVVWFCRIRGSPGPEQAGQEAGPEEAEQRPCLGCWGA